MSWQSYHLYPVETSDVCLARAVKPFVEHQIWGTKGRRFFFIRYEDEKGLHLRLRFKGESPWADDVLPDVFSGWFMDRGEIFTMNYEPESDRFEDCLPLVEEYFHISSQVSLIRLAQPQYLYGDAMFDTLRLHTISAYAAGITKYQLSEYFDKITEKWISVFFQSTDGQLLTARDKNEVFKHFDQKLVAQRRSIKETLLLLWDSLETGKLDKTQPEWLRWLRGNQLIFGELKEKTKEILPDLLHLTANRMGINNQDEVYLCYILKVCFQP